MNLQAPPPVLDYRPTEFFFRATYRWTRHPADRLNLFLSLARDHEQLRRAYQEATGAEPPAFEATHWEMLEKPWLNPFPVVCAGSCAPDSLPAAELVPFPDPRPPAELDSA